MMKKLTLPEDWASLPEVDDSTAQNAVRGFQVASEKTSSTRYIAEMIVSFQPEAVRRLLRNAGIPFGETQARPAVLLPVLRRSWRASALGSTPTPGVPHGPRSSRGTN